MLFHQTNESQHVANSHVCLPQVELFHKMSSEKGVFRPKKRKKYVLFSPNVSFNRAESAKMRFRTEFDLDSPSFNLIGALKWPGELENLHFQLLTLTHIFKLKNLLTGNDDFGPSKLLLCR